MSSAPWFKFYPGDYLADTQRLTQAQHGAYLLLLIEYYASGTPPPDDDEVLAAITRCAVDVWRSAIRSPCRRFFEIRDGCWFHKRVEDELSKRRNEKKARQDAALQTNRKLGRNTVTDTVTDTVTGTHSRYQIPDTRVPEPERSNPLSGKPDVAAPKNGSKPECQEILKFLNETAGKKFRDSKTNLDFIRCRLDDGITADQLRKIVVRKAREWLPDEKMREYLRPSTLFNKTKCEQYVGELVPSSEVKHEL